MSGWTRSMSREEVKSIDLFLGGRDSAIRDLVCQLLDRIEMNERTWNSHEDPHVLERCEARVEAYRYVIMTAIRCQETEEDRIMSIISRKQDILDGAST